MAFTAQRSSFISLQGAFGDRLFDLYTRMRRLGADRSESIWVLSSSLTMLAFIS